MPLESNTFPLWLTGVGCFLAPTNCNPPPVTSTSPAVPAASSVLPSKMLPSSTFRDGSQVSSSHAAPPPPLPLPRTSLFLKNVESVTVIAAGPVGGGQFAGDWPTSTNAACSLPPCSSFSRKLSSLSVTREARIDRALTFFACWNVRWPRVIAPASVEGTFPSSGPVTSVPSKPEVVPDLPSIEKLDPAGRVTPVGLARLAASHIPFRTITSPSPCWVAPATSLIAICRFEHSGWKRGGAGRRGADARNERAQRRGH